MKKYNTTTMTAKQTKKTYQPPRINRYGKISELTTGGSGKFGDQGTGAGKRPSTSTPSRR